MLQARIENAEVAHVREKPDNFDAGAAARKGVDWRDVVDVPDDALGDDEVLTPLRMTIKSDRVERGRLARRMTTEEIAERDQRARLASLKAAAEAVDLSGAGAVSNRDLRAVLRFFMATQT